MNKRNIGLVVRRLRKERGWTLTNLEQKADLCHGHASLIEKNKRPNLSPETLEKLSEAFGITMDELWKSSLSIDDTCSESEAA